MNHKMPLAFEDVRNGITSLARPSGESSRTTLWLVDRTLGIAKSASGRVEIFLSGRVSASLPLIRRHLEYGEWRASDSEQPFSASRVVLPEGAHFEPVAALIVIELLRTGTLEAPGALQIAFSTVEPIIEMALRNAALADTSIIGLLGELLTLEQLLISASAAKLDFAKVVSAWRGYERGARDFEVMSVGVEVKTTTGPISRHRINSLGQIEPRQLPNGSSEQLWLLSIGLTPVTGGSQSLASVVDRLLVLLKDSGPPGGSGLNALQDVLLENIARYSIGLETGYEHTSMRSLPAFQKTFEACFTPRLYDLCDAEVRLIRSADLRNTHVDSAEIEYTFVFPERINDRNPERGWQRLLVQSIAGSPSALSSH